MTTQNAENIGPCCADESDDETLKEFSSFTACMDLLMRDDEQAHRVGWLGSLYLTQQLARRPQLHVMVRDDRCEDVELEDTERAVKIARLLVSSTDTGMYGVALPCEAFGVLQSYVNVMAVINRGGLSCITIDGNGVSAQLEKPPKHKLFKLLGRKPRAESTRKRLGKQLRDLLQDA